MNIIKELSELVNVGIITPETSSKIQAHFHSKKGDSQNRLNIVFGILGAILVSLGIILILGHNWDDLSRTTKAIISFMPLLVGQGFAAYTLNNKMDKTVWRESSSVFLFFAIGASISLISQVYNIPGNFSTFMVTWMLLALPLVYLLKSGTVALLYVVGITIYAAMAYDSRSDIYNPYYFWIWMGLIVPYYYRLITQNPNSNFLTLMNWVLPISLTIILGTYARETGDLLYIAYISMFGIFYLLGRLNLFHNKRVLGNGFLVIGSLGTIVLLLLLSFQNSWSSIQINKSIDTDIYHYYKETKPFGWVEIIVAFVMTLGAGILLQIQSRKKHILDQSPINYTFIIFIFIYCLGMFTPIAATLINILILALSLWIIREGTRQDHFGILNYGLVIITALIICRFLDTHISFVIRGLLFILLGVGFFATNSYMLKKRRKNEE